MTLKMAIIMDPIAQVDFAKDSTSAMLVELHKRGVQLFYGQPSALSVEAGRSYGFLQPIEAINDPKNWYKLKEPQSMPLKDLDIILMRKDPPFDIDYIYATYFLELAQKEGVRVLNDPRSLRDCNEKFFTTVFPALCPPTLVSYSQAQIRAFIQKTGRCVVKPLGAMGGSSIFQVDIQSPNLNVIVEVLTQGGAKACMVQAFIPEIVEGDKRIFIINGKTIPFYLARIPAPDDFRGNLSANAGYETRPMGPQELSVAQTLGPELKARGLFFVGIDMIGSYLTEINVTSPTGVREIYADTGFDTTAYFIDELFATEKGHVS